MNSPLVSIGVPTYNRPKTLARTLNCLVNQSYTNLEIILSDNCSTDPDVEAVIKKFAVDSRVKYFKQSVNQGIIFNFNFVLEKANGDFFMRLADDDWLDTNYIELAISFLKNNPEYNGAYGYAKLYDKDEFVKQDTLCDFSESFAIERVVKYFKNVGYNGTFYGLMRRDCLSYLVTKSIIANDWLIVARVIASGKFKMLDNTNCYISLGGVSVSTENYVQAFNFSNFTKSFPFFAVSLNAFRDVLWASTAYKDLSLFLRFKLACKCFLTICKRFNVAKELKDGSKKFMEKIFSKR